MASRHCDDEEELPRKKVKLDISDSTDAGDSTPLPETQKEALETPLPTQYPPTAQSKPSVQPQTEAQSHTETSRRSPSLHPAELRCQTEADHEIQHQEKPKPSVPADVPVSSVHDQRRRRNATQKERAKIMLELDELRLRMRLLEPDEADDARSD
jgi:hypothetical protein